MKDFAVILVLVVVISAAVFYIIRQKKKGAKCIGCPYSEQCTKKHMECVDNKRQ